MEISSGFPFRRESAAGSDRYIVYNKREAKNIISRAWKEHTPAIILQN